MKQHKPPIITYTSFILVVKVEVLYKKKGKKKTQCSSFFFFGNRRRPTMILYMVSLRVVRIMT